MEDFNRGERRRVSAHERLAQALARAGISRTIMQLRRFAPVSVVSVVTFHHLHDLDTSYPYDPDVVDASPRQFRRRLETLARIGTPIGIDDLMRGIEGAALPPNPLLVTFDDGYRSCHDVALPILRELGIPATFFIATSFITERTLYWWERIAVAVRAARRPRTTITYPRLLTLDVRAPETRGILDDIVKDTRALDLERFLRELCLALEVDWSPAIEAAHAGELIMTWDQVRALARAGMAIESHTRRHRVLETLTSEDLRDELVGSRRDLEREIGRPVRALAYPVGRPVHDPEILRAVSAAGYRLGFANAGGVNTLWPAALRGALPFEPLDLRRISTDREMSDAMLLTQLAIPSFGY